MIAIHPLEKTLILGECKWSPKPVERKVLQGLVNKADSVIPRRSHWQVLFLGFARGGWTDAAQAYAVELGQKGCSGANWRSFGMQVLDLKRVDTDLMRGEASLNPSNP